VCDFAAASRKWRNYGRSDGEVMERTRVKYWTNHRENEA